MKTILLFLLMSLAANSQNFNYQRSWGTYFGDERFILRDSKTDRLGNLYIVGFFKNGASSSQPIFTYSNNYQSVFGGGESDGFIAKFNVLGQLTWATYFGGTNTDSISGIDFDATGNLYVVGETQSVNSIATVGSHQPALSGISDFFLAKFSTTGVLAWSTYFGGDSFDGFDTGFLYELSTYLVIAHDNANNLYIAGHSMSSGLGTAGTFQPIKEQSNQIITKFNNDGQPIWTTYYSANNNKILALKASTNALYVRGRINNCNPAFPTDNNYYGTANGFQPTALHCNNTFLSKFDVNGLRLWSTYYASSNSTSNNSLGIFQDKVYFSGFSFSNLVTTPGVFQESPGTEAPSYLVQFTASGTRDWGTYCGNNTGFAPFGGSFGSDGVTIDDQGGIYLFGITKLNNNIATAGAYQTTVSGQTDGYICKFDNQGQKIWGTYYGGNLQEFDTKMHNSVGDTFFVVGTTSSNANLTTSNSHQPNISIYNIANGTPKSIYISHFRPIPLSNTDLKTISASVFPNPNDGNFTVKLQVMGEENLSLEIFDVLGKKVKNQTISNMVTNIEANNLAKGVYILKISGGSNKVFNTKLVIQ